MAGNKSRNKGQTGEREIIRLLSPIIKEVYEKYSTGQIPMLERNQNQSNLGGYDIVGIDWLALEIKRQETLQLNAWWQQTLKQAKPYQTPVLIYRQNNKPWAVMLELEIDIGYRVLAQISFADFTKWFKLKLTARLISAVPTPC